MFNLAFYYYITELSVGVSTASWSPLFFVTKLTTSKYITVFYKSCLALLTTFSGATSLLLLTPIYEGYYNRLLTPYSINLGLFNCLATWHPLLTLVVFFFILDYLAFKGVPSLRLESLFFCTSLLAVYLGSRWSEQEIFWEGFWNWDPIELIIALQGLALFISVHMKLSRAKSLTVFTGVVFCTLLLSTTPITSSIHAFQNNPNFFLSMSLLYILASFFGYFIFDRRSRTLLPFILVLIVLVTNYSTSLLKIQNKGTFKNLVYTTGILSSPRLLILLSSLTFSILHLKSPHVFWAHTGVLILTVTYLWFFSDSVLFVKSTCLSALEPLGAFRRFAMLDYSNLSRITKIRFLTFSSNHRTDTTNSLFFKYNTCF